MARLPVRHLHIPAEEVTMWTRRARLALGAGVAVAGLTVGTVLAPALAAAASGEQTATAAVGKRVERLKDALQGLVDDGTIDQAQRDRVAEHLAEQGPARGPRELGRGPGGPGLGPAGRGVGALKVGLGVAAETLGMTRPELRSELRSGKSLADVAADKGVPLEELTAALRAEAVKRLDEAVAEGRLTRAEADRRKAVLDGHLAKAVQREGGRGRGHGWGPGGDPDGPEQPGDAEKREGEGRTEPSPDGS